MNEGIEHHHNVRIHIDRKPHESPNPTTGQALYALGKVREGYVLYRETFGDEEDPAMLRHDDHIHLVQNEHFYSEEHRDKGIKIFVNTEEKTIQQHRLTYEEIVKLAFPNPPPNDQKRVYVITFEDGPRHKPEGSIAEGQTVKIRNGEIFDVVPNNRS